MKPVSPTRSTIELVDGGTDCARSPSMGQRRAVEPRRKPMVLMGLSLQPAQHQKCSGPTNSSEEPRCSDRPSITGLVLKLHERPERRVDCMNTNLRYLAASRVD